VRIILRTAAVLVAVGGLLPSPPPFAEMLTEEGIPRRSHAVEARMQVPSPVAISGNGGRSERRPSSSAPAPRFFFAGNGRLRLAHAHFAETLDVRYRRADGTYDPAALARIEHFFRSREDGRAGPVSLRLVELLGYIEDHFHPKQMTLLSGYRSPEFNADLRAAGQKAAQASLHTEGLAADIVFSGVDQRRLWLQLRELQSGGAGYYKTGHFIHVDTGRPRFWEETTSRVDENLAAGNARVFARTDFDRYTDLGGGIVSLHSVTVYPLLVAPTATLVGTNGTTSVQLAPGDGTVARDGCIALDGPAADHQLKVVGVGAAAPRGRGHLELTTCEPRIERTPPEIDTNPVEIVTR